MVPALGQHGHVDDDSFVCTAVYCTTAVDNIHRMGNESNGGKMGGGGGREKRTAGAGITKTVAEQAKSAEQAIIY